jgi:hypothetical protein
MPGSWGTHASAMIDCHAHLAGEEFDVDRGAVRERAAAAGVHAILVVGEDPDDNARVLRVIAEGDEPDGAMGEGGGQILRSDGAVDPWLVDQLLLRLAMDRPSALRTSEVTHAHTISWTALRPINPAKAGRPVRFRAGAGPDHSDRDRPRGRER